jgi:hypothetical protein
MAETIVWRGDGADVAASTSVDRQDARMKEIMRERGFTSAAFIAGSLPIEARRARGAGVVTGKTGGVRDASGAKKAARISGRLESLC